MLYSPLEEFNIREIIRIYNKYYDITITNMTIYIIIGIITIYIIINIPNNKKIKSNKWRKTIEIIYNKLEIMNKDFLTGSNYLPFIFYLFFFLLINNLLGLLPYSFSTTSHFIITLTFSLSIIISLTYIGFTKYSFGFFKLFIPSGLTQGKIKYIIPLIFLIEIISYLSRIISLSVRLSTNLISGHILLHLISSLGSLLPLYLSFLPLFFLFPFFILELAVAIIQAYVFTLLTLSYIKDIYHLH